MVISAGFEPSITAVKELWPSLLVEETIKLIDFYSALPALADVSPNFLYAYLLLRICHLRAMTRPYKDCEWWSQSRTFPELVEPTFTTKAFNLTVISIFTSSTPSLLAPQGRIRTSTFQKCLLAGWISIPPYMRACGFASLALCWFAQRLYTLLFGWSIVKSYLSRCSPIKLLRASFLF